MSDNSGNAWGFKITSLIDPAQKEPLAITAQPSDYTGRVGGTAKFTIEATGEGLSYQWQYQNSNVADWSNSLQSGNKTNELSVPVTAGRNGQKYRCVITDANGHSVVSGSAAIVVS